METVDRLYSVFGYLSLAIYLTVMVKYVSKRLRRRSRIYRFLDKKLMKIHKVAGVTLVFMACIHGVLTIRSMASIGIIPYLLGGLCLLSCLATVVSFYWRKFYRAPKHWIVHHRLYAGISIMLFVMHIVLAK